MRPVLCSLRYAPYPLLYANCSLPHTLCPLPIALCPLPPVSISTKYVVQDSEDINAWRGPSLDQRMQFFNESLKLFSAETILHI